jgi:staphylococcal nuclease domain-containing protein 1
VLQVWADYDEEKEQAEQARINEANENDTPTVSKRLAHVLISQVVSASHFFMQSMAPESVASLESLMSRFGAYFRNSANQTPYPEVKAGDIVAARFTADNAWYRGRVRKVTHGGKQCHIMYIDYGNEETIEVASRIRKLPATFDLSVLPAQAMEAQLSYITAPKPESEYAAEAIERFQELTENKKLIVNIDSSVSNTHWVTLFDPAKARQMPESPIGLDFTTSINAQLVSDGFALPIPALSYKRQATSGPVPLPEFTEILQECTEEARRYRSGVFEYGDVDDEVF